LKKADNFNRRLLLQDSNKITFSNVKNLHRVIHPKFLP